MNNERNATSPFLFENPALYKLIGELGEQRKRAEIEANTVRHDMREISNALASLGRLGKILERSDLDLDTAIQEILDLIPLVWRHPDETAARIIHQGREYKTSNFIVETQWRHASDIMVEGKPKGLVEIFYLEERAPDFAGIQMWENGDLIGAFAAGIGLLFERHQLTGERNIQADIARKAQEKNKHISDRLSKAIAKLKSMKERSEETERRMHWLLAHISAELRTMLVGMTNLAGKGLETACKEMAEPLRQIKAEAENAIRTTNRIYDYAHISHGQFRHNNTEFRMRDVVENAVDQFYDRGRRNNVDLIAVIDPFVPNRVIGDGNRLSQILTYLLENALARSGEGEIVIRVNVEVSAHMLPVFHFVVVDNGPGIVVETKDRLFDVCSDDTNSLSRGNLYSRLGTAMAKHMVEILGGEIWIEERKDDTEGNEIHFTMWLDIVKERHNASEGNESNILSGSRILVAESSKTYRELYRLLLEYWGIEATIVSTGREALDHIKNDIDSRTPFAAVIIDSALSDMDGCKIADQILADSGRNKPAVIMTSSAGRPPDENRSGSGGVAAALGKPIGQAALQEALEAVIRGETRSEEYVEEDIEQPAPITEDQSQPPEEPNENQDQSQLREESSENQDQLHPPEEPNENQDQSQLREESSENQDQLQSPEESHEDQDQSQFREESSENQDQLQPPEEPNENQDQSQLREESSENQDQLQPPEEPNESQDQSQPPEESHEDQDQLRPPEKPNKRTVLLYDNGNDPHREMVTELIRKHGHAVVTAATGHEILEKIKSDEPGIVIIDAIMPDMYGLDVVKTVRSSEKNDKGHLPLIAIAPSNSGIDRQTGLEAGFDNLLNEPIAFNRLIEIIESNYPNTAAVEQPEEGQPQMVMHFDREKALKMVDNDPEMLTDIIEIFEDNCKIFLADLNDALTSSDFGKVIDVAAKICDAAENIGAMKIYETGKQLAALSFPDNRDRAREYAVLLHEECAEFRKIAEAFARTTLA